MKSEGGNENSMTCTLKRGVQSYRCYRMYHSPCVVIIDLKRFHIRVCNVCEGAEIARESAECGHSENKSYSMEEFEDVIKTIKVFLREIISSKSKV